ncbi:MAG TPA: ATP-binding protein [Gemmatimonadales bacterium]
MRTLRRRLTIWYTAALLATLFAFGFTLYVDRRISTARELDERLALEASLSGYWLATSQRVLERLVTPDESGQFKLDPGIAAYFEAFRDYLIVADPQGRPLFISETARPLPYASIERMIEPLYPPPLQRQYGTYTPDQRIGALRYVVQPVSGAAGQVGGILVAATFGSVVYGPSALLRSMMVALPVVVAASLLLGYGLAQSVKPMETMVLELEAISDGRSLHRRLPVPRTDDEVARLALAVNRMFARLEQSFVALHRFIADASHELKTPLMVLRAGVERALTNPRNPPDNLEALDNALAEVNRMTEMVENLLTLARADEGRAPLSVEPCDLRELVNEAVETAGMLAESEAIQVTTRIPDHSVPLNVDRNRIRQLLLNLVTNAVKYTPAGGSIGVELDDRGQDVMLQVKDTGIGIAPGDLPSIFDRFWRGDPSRSRVGAQPGTGLGLAITKWIAEAHGGTIAVQSRPGRGTTFTVVLPRFAEPPEGVPII